MTDLGDGLDQVQITSRITSELGVNDDLGNALARRMLSAIGSPGAMLTKAYRPDWVTIAPAGEEDEIALPWISTEVQATKYLGVFSELPEALYGNQEFSIRCTAACVLGDASVLLFRRNHCRLALTLDTPLRELASPIRFFPGGVLDRRFKSLLPVFTGFEGSRYQTHDDLISKWVSIFNRDKANAIGSTEDQATDIDDIDSALVKAWLIQESGGRDQGSVAAWNIDPAQVNVPGDWSEYRRSLGLTKPKGPNEGNASLNIRAAIGWCARKGFHRSGQPPKEQSNAAFDGWVEAFQNYNGRSEMTSNGKPYKVNYQERIFQRAANPNKHVQIELPLPNRGKVKPAGKRR